MLTIDTTKFSPTEVEILTLLSDGKPHHRDEIRDKCVLSTSTQVSQHIQRIRKKVARVGQAVPCVLEKGRICYQHVQLLDISQD